MVEAFMKYPNQMIRNLFYNYYFFLFSKTCCWMRFQVENIIKIVKSRVKL